MARKIRIPTESYIDISTFQPYGVLGIRGLRKKEEILDGRFDTFDIFSWTSGRKTIDYRKQIQSRYSIGTVAGHRFKLEGREEYRRKINNIILFENNDTKVILATELIIDKENFQHLKKIVEGSLKACEEAESDWRRYSHQHILHSRDEALKKYFEEYFEEHFD